MSEKQPKTDTKQKQNKDDPNLIYDRPLAVDELEECPFCHASGPEEGLKLYETGDHELWFVQCDECTAEGPKAITRSGAIELWNDRT